MNITRITYDVITFGDDEQGPTYRRFLDGSWEVELWSHIEDWFWSPVEDARLERGLEEEYQKEKARR